MTDSAPSAVDKSQSVKRRFRHSRKLSLMKVLLLNLTIILIPTIFYVVSIVTARQKSQTERGFRALAEIEQQVQLKAAALFNIGEVWDDRNYEETNNGLTGKTVFPTLKLEENQPQQTQIVEQAAEPSSARKLPTQLPRLDEAGFVRLESKHWSLSTSFSDYLSGLSEELPFDELIVANLLGKVLAEVPRATRIEHLPTIHKEIHGGARLIELSQLIKQTDFLDRLREAKINGSETLPDAFLAKMLGDQNNLPARSLQTSQEVGGQRYRVFIQPIRIEKLRSGCASEPTVAEIEPTSGENKSTAIASPTAAADKPNCGSDDDGATVMLLVGLNRESMLSRLTRKLGPAEALFAVLVLVTLVLCWPLIRLAFLEPNDSLSRSYICVLGFSGAMLAGLIMISFLALRGYQRTEALGENYAVEIAKDIETSYDAEFSEALVWLRNARQSFEPLIAVASAFPNSGHAEGIIKKLRAALVANEPWQRLPWPRPSRLPWVPLKNLLPVVDIWRQVLWIQQPNFTVQEVNEEVASALCKHNFMLAAWRSTPDDQVYRASTIVATNSAGCLIGPVLRINGKDPVGGSFSLAPREYFRALSIDRGTWFNGTPQVTVQRLNNLRDGQKITQIAIPREPLAGKFNGIVTLDWHFTSVINAVLPFGFRFAIFDEGNGSVLYHSDDRRALVENIFSETGRPPTLMAAIAQHRNQAFSGDYMGEHHQFYYRPMKSFAWGLLVFRPSGPLKTTVMATAISALSALSGYLAVSLLVLWVLAQIPLARANALWPHWRMRNGYPGLIILMLLINAAWIVRVNIAVDIAASELFFLCMLVVAVAWLASLAFYSKRFDIAHVVSWTLTILASVGALFATYTQVCTFSTEAAGTIVCLVLFTLPLVLAVALLFWQWNRAKMTSGPITDRPWREQPWFHLFSRFPKLALTSPINFHRIYTLAVALALLAIGFWPAYALYIDASNVQSKGAIELYSQSSLREFRVRQLAIKTRDARWQASQSDANRAIETQQGVHGFQGRDGFSPVMTIAKFTNRSCKESRNPASASTGWLARFWQSLPYLANLDGGRARMDGTSQDRVWCVLDAEVEGRANQTFAKGFLAPLDLALHPERMGAGGTAGTSIAPGLLWLALFSALALWLRAGSQAIARVLGTGLPFSGQSYRLNSIEQLIKSNDRVLLERPTPAALETLCQWPPAKLQHFDLREWPPSSAPLLFNANANGARVILEHFDVAALDVARRELVLAALEQLVKIKKLEIYILVASSPLFRLLRPQDFPDVPENERLSDNMQLRFANVFSLFRKCHGDLDGPTQAYSQEDLISADPELRDFVERETRIFWPELLPLRQRLLARLKINAHHEVATREDLLDEIEEQAGALFRARWLQCTREERLAMYQLAARRLVNASNERVVAQLLRRGILCAEPEPRLRSRAFANFVLTAEPPQNFENWVDEASQGTWQTIRMPLLIMLLLVIAWIAYSADELFQALSAVLASTIVFVGRLLQAGGMLRGTGDRTT